jgi:N-methylhydantoinase A
VEEEHDPAKAGLDADALMAAFHQAHERRYGYCDPDGPVELVNMRASAWGAAPRLRPSAGAGESTHELRPVRIGGRWVQTEIHRGEPAPGAEIDGPALWALPQATLLVPPGWSGVVDEHGTVHLRRSEG